MKKKKKLRQNIFHRIQELFESGRIGFRGYYPIFEFESKWNDPVYHHLKWFSLSSGIGSHYEGKEYYISFTILNFWFRLGIDTPGMLARKH